MNPYRGDQTERHHEETLKNKLFVHFLKIILCSENVQEVALMVLS